MLIVNVLKKYVLIPSVSIIYITNVVAGFIVAYMIKMVLPISTVRNKITFWQKKEWLHLTIAYGCVFFTKPIYVAYNKEILTKKKCIVISNHLTNYDWLMLLIVLQRFNMYDDVYILIKHSLSKIPIFGSSMKEFNYIFVKRNWRQDLTTLKRSLEDLKRKNKFFLLIFPEGTIFVPSQHRKSLEYSKKANLIYRNNKFLPQNVLVPRLLGTQTMYKILKRNIDGIIDVTIFIRPYCQYPQEIFTYTDVYFKKTGKIGFFMILDMFYETESEDWLYQLFESKNDTIEKYKQNSHYFHKIDDHRDFMEKFKRIKNAEYTIIDISLIRWRNLLYLLSFMGFICLFYTIIIAIKALLRNIYIKSMVSST